MKTKYFITALSITALALTGCSTGTTEDAGKTIQPLMVQKDGYDADMPMDGDYDPAMLDDFNPMDGMGVMEAGEYEVYSMDGAHITFDLPADPEDEALQEIEQYRKDVQADPVTYIVADVDNRGGSNSVDMYQVAVFDEDGNKYEFSEVSNYISDIAPRTDWEGDDETYLLPNGERLSREEGSDLYSRNVDLHNEYLYGASVGERKTLIRVYEGDDLPDEFTRVSVMSSGAYEEVEAFPSDF